MLTAVTLPGTAAAEPVSIGAQSVASAATVLLSPGHLMRGTPVTIAEIAVTEDGDIAIQVGGLNPGGMPVPGAASRWNRLAAGVLDPLGTDDELDVAPFNAGVPDGFSTSNGVQSASLARSAVFAGGLPTLTIPANTAFVLIFSGVAGPNAALRVAFGLGNHDGGSPLLASFGGADAVSTPEPASMILIGTGLMGVAALRRRRNRNRGELG
jgi:hypothetical protein